jgi:hypothetical protein
VLEVILSSEAEDSSWRMSGVEIISSVECSPVPEDLVVDATKDRGELVGP